VPDRSALEALILEQRHRVARLVARFFRRREDVEELAQEVFVRALRAAGSYNGSAPVGHWVMRIATHVCLDELRRRRVRPEHVLSEVTDSTIEALDRALAGGAIEAFEIEDARALASDLLGTLPPKDRLVLVMMEIEGFTAAETAAMMGATTGGVKMRAMRAKRRLARLARGLGRKG